MATLLDGTQWTLAALDNAPYAPTNERFAVTLVFTPAAEAQSARSSQVRVGGNAGCNRYFGVARVSDGAIEFGALGVTRMACPPPQMELEARYLKALAAVSRWAVDAPTLTLFGDGVALHFAAERDAHQP